MEVGQIWRYPVKSMVGDTVAAVDVVETGLVGDRTWAARDQVRGGIRGAKQLGGLMRLSARPVEGPGGHVSITLPDGSTVTTADAGVGAAVSAAIDHEVTLEPLAPADDVDHYRRGEMYHDDLMEDLRATFGRVGDEPLPDLSAFPPEILEFESPPGTYHDVHPLLLMTTSALAALGDALPDSDVDVRRFRPSLVIDTGDQPGHVEMGWIGQQVTVGEVELDVVGGCPRCVMVTREVGTDVPADRQVLRHIVADLGQDVGVYATVARPGRIATGDPVQVGGAAT
ncbi:MAG: MOSC domain-containing protein [Iamia sp.]